MLHLLRPLGEGGMGKVWVARHKGLETEVVVKFLAASEADRAEAEVRFAREAAAAAAVKSPHVVQVFDHGTTAAGTRYIVMELLEGRDLAMHLAAKGPMPPRDVAAVIGQVAKALSKAHQAGVIHRDIKPENIFLCDGDGGEMFVKVLDFGIAKRQEQATTNTSTGQVVGTPFYMSPEQILGEPPVDTRTDIWSLGVVAFEALTGRRPFDGATVGAITLAIHRSTPRPSAVNPAVPPAVDEWFTRACARAPAERFATAREAGQALVEAVGDPGNPSGMFRTPMMSLSDTSDPSLVAHVASNEAQGRSVTSLSSSFAAPPSRRGPPRVVLAGAGVVIAVLAVLLVFSLRRSQAPELGGTAATTLPSAASVGSAPSIEPPTVTSVATVASAALPAAPSATATTRPRVPTTTSTAAHAPTGARTARPPRRPNDDDIK